MNSRCQFLYAKGLVTLAKTTRQVLEAGEKTPRPGESWTLVPKDFSSAEAFATS